MIRRPAVLLLVALLAADRTVGSACGVDGAVWLAKGARVDSRGLALSGTDDAVVAIGLRALGRGSSMRELDLLAPLSIDGPRVTLARALGVVEWWRALPNGLEHGVTLDARPLGEGTLALELTTGRGVTARLVDDDAIVLATASGVAVARYQGLLVVDAEGVRVPGRLVAAGERIRIEIEDGGARYPIVVDPVLYALEEATLSAPSAEADPGDELGYAVALSSDGTRALVSATRDDNAVGIDTGNVRVFLRSGTSWSEEAMLLQSGPPPHEFYFGESVSITGDAVRAIVGQSRGYNASSVSTGNAHVFVRSGTTWTEEARLLATGGAFGDSFGATLAISSDGLRVIVGAPRDDTTAGADAGSAQVFVRTGTTWTQEASLLAAGGAAGENFGSSVSMTADGSRAIIGAPDDATAFGASAGSARVFSRTGSVWTEEAALYPAAGAATGAAGTAVSISGDGTRALVTVLFGVAPSGRCARVFTRSGTTWTEEATLVPSGSADQFGFAATMSNDGSRAFIGAAAYIVSAAGRFHGSVWVYTRSGTTWTEAATAIASDREEGDQLGASIAVSSDGSMLLAGAHWDDTSVGTRAGTARFFRLVTAATAGTVCTLDRACASGFCVDGYCCASACGGGSATDCQACAASLTGALDGSCAPLGAAVAPAVTCRSSVGPCDLDEQCVSTSTACPADGFAVAGVACRAMASTCDVADVCDGTSAACVDVAAATGAGCRPSTGPCDDAEVCDGSSFACPGDVLAASGTPCRPPSGACDVEEYCDGASATCPSDSFLPAGAMCRPAMGPCDVADTCSGSEASCPDVFAVAATVCNAIVSDVCDAPDHCDGSGAGCPAEFLSGVECRAAAGACDLPERCNGDVPFCPLDQVLAGVSCRASVDAACDPTEACDGVATGCPADVTACGVDAGASSDAGLVAFDAAEPPDATVAADGADAGAVLAASGCGCRVTTGRTSSMTRLSALLWVLMISRRVARARGRSGLWSSGRGQR